MTGIGPRVGAGIAGDYRIRVVPDKLNVDPRLRGAIVYPGKDPQLGVETWAELVAPYGEQRECVTALLARPSIGQEDREPLGGVAI